MSHAYDLDVEDINELLLFRAALVPKTWVDSYEDTISKTATEVAECLDDMLDEKAKVDGGLRKGKKQKFKPAKENNKKLTWAQKQKRRRERLKREKAKKKQ